MVTRWIDMLKTASGRTSEEGMRWWEGRGL